MSQFKIPVSKPPSTQPSALTQAEIANLSAPKRNTVLYERAIERLEDYIKYLQKKLDDSENERKASLEKLENYIDNSDKIPLLKQENFEMYITFALATVCMAIGSALISSYPKTATETPWLFGFGWAMVVLSAFFGIFKKPIVWIYYKVTKEDKKSSPNNQTNKNQIDPSV